MASTAFCQKEFSGEGREERKTEKERETERQKETETERMRMTMRASTWLSDDMPSFDCVPLIRLIRLARYNV